MMTILGKSQSGHVWSSTTTNKRHRHSKTTPFCIYEKLRRLLAGRSGALNGIKGVPEMFRGVRTHIISPWTLKFCSCKWHWRPRPVFYRTISTHTKAGRARAFPFRPPGVTQTRTGAHANPRHPPRGSPPKWWRGFEPLIVCGSHVCAIEEMNRD
jgi:hypothetical protein